jgi:hypothetical protein
MLAQCSKLHSTVHDCACCNTWSRHSCAITVVLHPRFSTSSIGNFPDTKRLQQTLTAWRMCLKTSVCTDSYSSCRSPQYVSYQVVGAVTCIIASVAYAGTATSTSHLSKRFPFITRMRPGILAVATSIPGTQSLLHSKCLATMVIVSLGQANQIGHWFFWVAALVMIAAAAFWTAALAHGMNVFPTVIVLPILQVCST